MGRSLILETSFLIDLEREHVRGTPTGAVQFLERLEAARLCLPSIVAGELAAGVSMANRPRWEAFLAPFFLLPVTPDVAWEYGRASRHLRGVGQARPAPRGRVLLSDRVARRRRMMRRCASRLSC